MSDWLKERIKLGKTDLEAAFEARNCFRFALTNPNIDIAITGPSKTAQLEENIRETAKGPMAAEELEWMRRISDYVYGRS